MFPPCCACAANLGAHDDKFLQATVVLVHSPFPLPKPVVFWRAPRYKFVVEVVVSAAYGTSLVGGAPLSEWLQAGNITTTLFAGLFRPVASVRQQIVETSTQLFPLNGQVCFPVSEDGLLPILRIYDVHVHQ